MTTITQGMVKQDFDKLFYTVYPNGTTKENKAQFMVFFWAGYTTCHGDFLRMAMVAATPQEGLKAVAEKAVIAKDRCQFIADKIAKGDYSHKMFQ